MPKRSSKKRPRDINQLAVSIIEEATAEEEPQNEEATKEVPADGKNPAAVALGRLGGKKGGPARAKKLTPEQRKEIARNAARTRWQRQSQ